MSFKTADLSDENEGRVQIVQPGLINYGGNTRFHGEIVTIKSFDDNSRIREQVNLPGHGKVLVIDNEASLRCAMLGDMLAAAAIENGWQAVVINGCIRDAADLCQMSIGVKALATNPLRSVKKIRVWSMSSWSFSVPAFVQVNFCTVTKTASSCHRWL